MRLPRRQFMAGAAGAGLAMTARWHPAAAMDGGALDTLMVEAVEGRNVPFLVAMVGNAGGVLWEGVAGESRPGVPASLETVFRIYSMTKAIGSTAAMILIDRGELDMDTPVREILPEFADLQVLEGFDGDEPILRKANTDATIRNLATHISGLVYEFWNPDIARYLEVSGHPTVVTGTREALNYPLAFDSGERWDYGMGIDWLGLVVEKVDGRRINEFCQAEIFDPLAMPDTLFELDDARSTRLADAVARAEDGGFEPTELAPPSQPEVYGMGHALYSTAPDYLRFLRMFLNKGELDGARVLSEAAVDEMLANQIGDIRVPKMVTAAPFLTADVELFPGTPKTHSFGFLRVEEDVPGRRAAGSQGWAGVCNTHYWFDPTNDVAAVLMTQTLPFVEPPYMEVYDRFERAVYAG